MRTRSTSMVLFAMAWTGAAACAGGAEEDREPGPGAAVLRHQFPSVRVGPLEETTALCQSWTLDNDEPIHVNAVAMTNESGFHHSNWFFVPESEYAGPDGTWDCAERGWDQLHAAVSGGVMFAMSTQVTEEVQAFPAGAVYTIPPRSRIVGNLHILNASDEPLETSLAMEVHTLAPEEVTVRLAPMALTYQALAIPPNARSRFEAECDLATAYGAPIDFNFYYVLPHYHALGTAALFEAVGGPGGARTILEQSGGVGDVLSQTLDPPVSGGGASHLRFGCEFASTRDETVRWGDGDAEMCIVVAWQDSGFTWLGAVTRDSQPTRVDEDGVQVFEGPCDVAFAPIRS